MTKIIRRSGFLPFVIYFRIIFFVFANIYQNGMKLGILRINTVKSFCVVSLTVLGLLSAFGETVALKGLPFKIPEYQVPDVVNRDFNIADFGAKSDGTKCTASISRAVEACAAAGGGRVVVPKGVFFTGAVHLKSNVTLHLSEDAVLDFSDDPSDYMPAVISSYEGIECMSRSPLVYAYACTNVSITGLGMLKPRLRYWLSISGSRAANSLSRRAADQLTLWGDLGTPIVERDFVGLEQSRVRPPLIQFNRCHGVKLEDFRVKGTPFWTIHLFRCVNVVARRLDVCCHPDDVHTPDYNAGVHLNNSDGIDVEMTRNVLIEGCTFCQGDDAVVIKSGRGPEGYLRGVPSENIVVRDCEVKLGHGLVCIGSELSAGVRNVFCTDCRVREVRNLFFVKTNRYRAGFAENLWCQNVTGEKVWTILRVNSHYPASSLSPESKVAEPTVVRNIHVKNVNIGEVRRPVEILGDPDVPAENLSVQGVVVGLLVPNPVPRANDHNTPQSGPVFTRGEPIVTINVRDFRCEGVRILETTSEKLAFPLW